MVIFLCFYSEICDDQLFLIYANQINASQMYSTSFRNLFYNPKAWMCQINPPKKYPQMSDFSLDMIWCQNTPNDALTNHTHPLVTQRRL